MEGPNFQKLKVMRSNLLLLSMREPNHKHAIDEESNVQLSLKIKIILKILE